jgi:FkbM family methyltransferase
MTQYSQGNSIFKTLTSISRKLTFAPRGKIGTILNKITGQLSQNPIITYKANNDLHYIADLRSYTENYTPWTGEYEGKTIDKILSIIPDGNYLDIGGNVGYWSLNLANKNVGKVYTFEPLKENFARINDHILLNQLQDRIIPINVGLTDIPMNVTARINDIDRDNNAATYNAQLIPTDEINNSIQLKTLDEIVESYKIDSFSFIKIDIEGFEMKAIRGGLKSITKNRPLIYGEFTPKQILESGDNPKELFELLKDYTVYQEISYGKFEILETKEYHRDLLLVPNEYLPKIKHLI